MEVSVKQVYTSVACNRTPEIVDWNWNGVICFGATNAVVIYYPNRKGNNITVLSHHTSKVNSVKWLNKHKGECTELVSCSADKTAAIWTFVDNEWKVTSKLTGHTDGVTCVFGLYTKEDDLVIYTGSIDSTVKVWERINGEISLKQTISLNSGLCLTFHAHLLPLVDKPLLFCALDDHKIHVFAGDEEYHKVHTLVGHEDWVRGMDVLNVDNTTILLASGSQDTYIRLWRIQQHTALAPSQEIRVEEKVFQAYGHDWSVKLDAVLAGHEGWVYGVQWHPYEIVNDSYKKVPVYRLLSSSLDKTLIVWEPEEGGGVWVERVRVGEVGGNGLGFYGSRFGPKGDTFLGHGYNGSFHIWSVCKVSVYCLLSSSLDKTLIVWEPEEGGGVWAERVRVGEVGGNGLGFYGSRFGPKGDTFLGHGYNGSFHIWSVCKESGQWEPQVVCGGHFGAVEDLRWEPRLGRYLTSVSADQTTRVHAPWKRDGDDPEWHEIARPQVHGYDLASLALVNSTTFASAAEEKIIRVFRAPHNFLHNFKSIVGEDLVDDGAGGEGVGPEGASVPSLGLSNKAVFSGDAAQPDDDDRYFVPVTLTEPPTEETLMQNTLWPEAHKLYGHGYEVFALDASPDGSLLASACKATTAEHAAVLIWETTNWQQIQKLVSHQLTVTQLAFSPDSQKLVSVSRDRRWTLYRRTEGSNSFAIAASTDKTNGVHSRIIWCCAWAHDSSVFATGSREGKVCVWSQTDTKQSSSLNDYALCSSHVEPNASVTVLAFAPLLLEGSRLVALGLESGLVKIYSFGPSGWTLLHEINNSAAHHLTVRRLSFSPQLRARTALLASCGSDHLLRIHALHIAGRYTQ